MKPEEKQAPLVLSPPSSMWYERGTDYRTQIKAEEMLPVGFWLFLGFLAGYGVAWFMNFLGK